MNLEKEIRDLGRSFGLYIVFSVMLSLVIITWSLYDVYCMLFISIWSDELSKKFAFQASFYILFHILKLYLLCWLAGLMTLEVFQFIQKKKKNQ